MDPTDSSESEVHPIWKHFTAFNDSVRCRYCQLRCFDGDLNILMGHLNEMHSNEDLAELQQFVEKSNLQYDDSAETETTSQVPSNLSWSLDDIFADDHIDRIFTPDANDENEDCAVIGGQPAATADRFYEVPHHWKLVQRFPTLAEMRTFLNAQQAVRYFKRRNGIVLKEFYKACTFNECRYKLLSVQSDVELAVYEYASHDHPSIPSPSSSSSSLFCDSPTTSVSTMKFFVQPGPLTSEQFNCLHMIAIDLNLKFVTLERPTFGYEKDVYMITFTPRISDILVSYHHEGTVPKYDIWPMTNWKFFLSALRSKCAIFFDNL